MSVSVDGTAITMTRGDTVLIRFTLKHGQETYAPEENDVIRFAVKHPKMTSGNKQYKDEEPLIDITIPNDTLTLTISPQDTKSLDFGTYVYDVQITFADGTVDTFISQDPDDPNYATLTLTPEVD